MPDVIVFITIVASQLTQSKPTMLLACVIWDQFNDNFDALWLKKETHGNCSKTKCKLKTHKFLYDSFLEFQIIDKWKTNILIRRII